MATIKTIQENEEELWKTYTPKMNEKIAESDAIYDSQKNTVTTLYDGKISDAKQQYEEDLRANEVQKYINARAVAENNANLGLTDSGLNRTQQTAVLLSASNNAAKIQRARQSAVDELTRLMTADLAEIEGNKSAAQIGIKDKYENLVNSAAVAKYEADWEAETARIKAEIEAETKRIQEETKRIENYNKSLIEASNKATETKKADYNALVANIEKCKGDIDACARLIRKYCWDHDVDEKEKDLILGLAGLESDEYNHFIAYGTAYASGNMNQANADKDGYYPGKQKYDEEYIKSGEQEYIVELVKATWNFGGFFNSKETVDGNDVVNIYYPDGTPVATNLKLKNIHNNTSAQRITNWTAGKNSDHYGTREKMSLDLSKALLKL